jgi:hypothetical protein
MSLMLPTLWIASYYIDRGENCLAFGYQFFAMIEDGQIALSDDMDSDSGHARPAFISPRRFIWPKALHVCEAKIPGLEFHFGYMSNGRIVWSIGMSFLIPTVLSFLTTAFLFYRLRRKNLPAAASLPNPS